MIKRIVVMEATRHSAAWRIEDYDEIRKEDRWHTTNLGPLRVLSNFAMTQMSDSHDGEHASFDKWIADAMAHILCKPDLSREFQPASRRRGIRFVDEPSADEGVVRALPVTETFPTHQRLKDKLRKKDGAAVRHRPQNVEQHFDDCGDDMTPLEREGEALATFWDESWSQSARTPQIRYEEQAHYMISPRFGFAGLKYSLGDLARIGALSEKAEHCRGMSDFVGKSAPPCYPYDDVVEICRGRGPNLAMLVTRGHLRGQVQRFVCEFDFHHTWDVQQFWQYLSEGAPTVLVLSLPSAGLYGQNYDNISVHVAKYQVDCGRHFIAERHRVGTNKMFKSSSPELLHGIQVQRNSWHTLRNNVADLIMNKRMRQVVSIFPATVGGSEPSGQHCIGCKRGRVSTDPEHNRVPGVCKYPLVESVVWTCPACAAHRPAHDDRHTLVAGECRAAQMQIRKFGHRKHNSSRAPQPRAPIVKAHEDSTAKLPPRAPRPDEPDAPPDPAASRRLPEASAAPGASSSREPGAAAPRQPSEPPPAQTGATTEPQEWTAFDVGHALRLLHSRCDEVVRRTLRRLHVRYWHAPAKRLKELLQHAGAPAKALEMAKQVVDTCRVCRMWARPGPRSMTSTRLATGFNEAVQWDILFLAEAMVSHCIDEATRWSAGGVLGDKTAITIIGAITHHWVRPYGPMRLLVTDQESGLTGEEAAQWLDRWSIQIKTREPGAHAQLVERHHELLRQLVHRVQVQLREERIKMPFEIIAAECFLVKNLLISVGGSSPYQAVFGRVPPLLAEFEPASECQVDDASAGIPGISRSHHRLRELTLQSMVDLTAKKRMERALNSKTRLAQQQLDLQPGDQVDFFRTPATKDESGWRGPAQVVQAGPPAVIKWQDRFIQVRTQDLRRSLVYLGLLSGDWSVETGVYEDPTTSAWFMVKPENPVHVVQAFADNLDAKVIRLGWLFDESWRRAEANARHSEIVWAILHVAACGFHLVGCIGARVGGGVAKLEGLVQCDHSFLWWWRRGDPRNSWYFDSAGGARILLSEVFGKDRWPFTSFVQFLMASDEGVSQIRRQEPLIPHVGGPHVPFPMPPCRPDSDLAPQPPARWSAPGGDFSRSRTRSPASSVGAPTSEKLPSTPGTERSRTPRGVGRHKEAASKKQSKRKPDTGEGSAPANKENTMTDAPTTGGDIPADTGGAASSGEPILPLAQDDDVDSLDAVGDTGSEATLEYPDSMFIFERMAETSGGLPTDAMASITMEPDVEHDIGWTGCNPNPLAAGAATEQPALCSYAVGSEVVELGIAGRLSDWVYPEITNCRRTRLKNGEIYVVKFYHAGQAPEVVVEREMNILTLQEAQHHEADVRKAIYDELARWVALGGFERYPRTKARNILDSRWVLKWKVVNGKRITKARLTARGFRDAQANEVHTYAGTATRWSQRLVNVMCAQRKWTLFSADVSQAFLRGLTFEQIESMEGEIHREVQITVPPGSVPVLQQIEGYETFNPNTEVLRMLRGGFGLKDAPRLWQKMLQIVLEKIGVVSLHTDPKLYVYRQDGDLRLVMSWRFGRFEGRG